MAMASTSRSERFETVIIGGGQAGLAVGYHLARRERSVVILDANEQIGDSWRKRWESLRVFTPARYDGLPGWSFPAPGWSYPTKDEVADYLESYAARFRLPVRTGIRVDGLSRENGGYVVTSGQSRCEADNVVVATGGYQTPRIPAFASELDPSILQLHSSEYRDPSQLREGGVLVVGAGNSGAEIALESSAGHPTWLSGRDTGQEPVRAERPAGSAVHTAVLVPALPRVDPADADRPKGRHQLSNRGLPLARVRRKDLFRAGVQRVPRMTGVRDGRPMLADGGVLDVANVIWCTGFVPDFSWIDLPVFNPDGEPRHERGVVRSEPGLYFIGLFFLYAGSSSLIGGVGRDARHIALHIASQRAEGGRAERAAFRTGETASDLSEGALARPAGTGSFLRGGGHAGHRDIERARPVSRQVATPPTTGSAVSRTRAPLGTASKNTVTTPPRTNTALATVEKARVTGRSLLEITAPVATSPRTARPSGNHRAVEVVASQPIAPAANEADTQAKPSATRGKPGPATSDPECTFSVMAPSCVRRPRSGTRILFTRQARSPRWRPGSAKNDCGRTEVDDDRQQVLYDGGQRTGAERRVLPESLQQPRQRHRHRRRDGARRE